MPIISVNTLPKWEYQGVGKQPPERSDQQISAAQEACLRALRKLGELRRSIEVIKVSWSDYLDNLKDHAPKVALIFTTIVREEEIKDTKFEIILELRDGVISVNNGKFSQAAYSLIDPETLSVQLVGAIKAGFSQHIARVHTRVVNLEGMLHKIPT